MPNIIREKMFLIQMLEDGKPDRYGNHCFFVYWKNKYKPNGFGCQIFRTNIDKFIKNTHEDRPEMKIEFWERENGKIEIK